jgi:hypothetical protein
VTYSEGTVLPHPLEKRFTIRRPSSRTRRCCIKLSLIVQYSRRLPPVGVWPVCQWGHPLRSPNRRSLGRPLPYQRADDPQAPPEAPLLREALDLEPLTSRTTCGISSPFELLFTHFRVGHLRVTHPFATKSPYCYKLFVRLACLKHAASVHPEPGSNSP